MEMWKGNPIKKNSLNSTNAPASLETKNDVNACVEECLWRHSQSSSRFSSSDSFIVMLLPRDPMVTEAVASSTLTVFVRLLINVFKQLLLLLFVKTLVSGWCFNMRKKTRLVLYKQLQLKGLIKNMDHQDKFHGENGFVEKNVLNQNKKCLVLLGETLFN